MSENTTLLALFDEIDPAANAVEKLRSLGISDEQMEVISGTPVTVEMLGRPHVPTRVPRFALGGALAGFMVGLFFAVATPNMYPILVGGQPLIPIPPGIIVVFEMTMLVMLIATFLGVFLENYYPSYGEKEYVPEISDGEIALFFACPTNEQAALQQAMTDAGAKAVRLAERQQP